MKRVFGAVFDNFGIVDRCPTSPIRNLTYITKQGPIAQNEWGSIYHHSHPMPSLSLSRWLPYPGSPRLTGAAPAARAAEQFRYEALPPP